jgi:magnesium chelatase subunit I
VDVKGDRDPAIRKEVVKRRIAFENDPKGYTESCADESENLRESIMFARKHLKEVRVDDEIYDAIVNITSHFEIDGHRADITLIRAAKANAAFHRRAMVIKNDIRDVAHLVLAHRMRRRPFEESVLDEEELESCLNGM